MKFLVDMLNHAQWLIIDYNHPIFWLWVLNNNLGAFIYTFVGLENLEGVKIVLNLQGGGIKIMYTFNDYYESYFYFSYFVTIDLWTTVIETT